MHAVAVPGPGPGLTIEAGLGLQLPAECLGALEVLGLRLSVQLPGLVCLVRGAGLVTSLTGGPGALGEAPAEPVLGMGPLIVVREISGHSDKHRFMNQRCCLLGPADSPALGLARVSGHDVLIPVQQPVVPITLLVDPDQNS